MNRKKCQRPSWTHLEDQPFAATSDGSPDLPGSAGNKSDSGAPLDGMDSRRGSANGGPIEEFREYGAQVVVDLSDADEATIEREAALNFLRDFHATPAPIPEREPSEAPLEGSPSKMPRRRDVQVHLQEEEPRYLGLWTVEDRDLSAAASVWKSSAKAVSSTKGNWSGGKAAPSAALAGTGTGMTATRSQRSIASSTTASAVDLEKYNAPAARRAIEAARSETRLP